MLPSHRRTRPIDPPELPPFNWKKTLVGLVRRLREGSTPRALRACGRWPSADRVTSLPRRRR
jgi:hypothetical protein